MFDGPKLDWQPTYLVVRDETRTARDREERRGGAGGEQARTGSFDPWSGRKGFGRVWNDATTVRQSIGVKGVTFRTDFFWGAMMSTLFLHIVYVV